MVEFIDQAIMFNDDPEPIKHMPASDIKPEKQEEEDIMFMLDLVSPEPEPGMVEKLDPAVKRDERRRAP